MLILLQITAITITLLFFLQFRSGSGFWHELLRPFQSTTLERLALSQMEIASDVYANIGEANDGNYNGLLVEDLVIFTVHALEHRSNEVTHLSRTLFDKKIFMSCILPFRCVNSPSP